MTRLDVFIQVSDDSHAEAIAAHEAAGHYTTLAPKIAALAAVKAEKMEYVR